MNKKFLLVLIFCACQIFLARSASAGIDLSGFVKRVNIFGDGSLWFVIDNPDISRYCLPGWFDFNLYIPANHPQYSYYYGILMTAVVKNKGVLIANISKFNGTTGCDITQTGYGITILN